MSATSQSIPQADRSVEVAAVPTDPTWCCFCDRPRNDCACHLDPNGLPEGHWSKQQDIPSNMTDEEALAKAQSIWGPNVSVQHDTSIGCFARECFVAIVWDEDKRNAKVVASAFSYLSTSDAPASWEAMFAKGAL